MNAKTLWIGFAVVVIGLAVAAWYWSTLQPPEAATENTAAVAGADQFVDDSKDGGVSASATINLGNTATITYTDAGFSPSSLTVKKGTTVTFVNKSTHDMWIGSNQHPSHTGYDGTSKDDHCAAGYAGAAPLDQCGAGARYSFTFSKEGTWGYHNHKEDDDRGTIVVVP